MLASTYALQMQVNCMVKMSLNFLQLIITKDGNINLNFDDDIVKGTLYYT